MIKNLNSLIFKAFCILLFIIIFYKLINMSSYSYNHNNSFDTFIDSSSEKVNYLKLNETYIDENELSLDLLYTNYTGDNLGNNIWENKTLSQCTDICNKLDGCEGFTRDLILDTEPGKCYPHNKINKCYSNRKGNMSQMQNAIKYNSFIKSNVPNIINTCIGDNDLTLNRIIFIKSYKLPNTCLGINSDSRVSLVDINSTNFKQMCNFRIEKGQDGIGTVSFLHIDTGKYLFRDISNMLIIKNINSSQTENEQRASFNLYDSTISYDSIMIKALPIEGEITDNFITLDGNYLKISPIINNNKSVDDDNINENDKSTFYIIDSIVKSNIITNKNKIPINKETTIPQTTIPQSTIPQSTISQTTIPQTNQKNIAQENFTVNLDSTDSLPIYQNLFNPPDTVILPQYLTDNYLISSKNNPKYMTISNKINDTIINNQLSSSLTKYQDEYNSSYKLNIEIEKEINNLNLGFNAKNDKIINNLDKMRITDMANDYFFLQNFIKNK